MRELPSLKELLTADRIVSSYKGINWEATVFENAYLDCEEYGFYKFTSLVKVEDQVMELSADTIEKLVTDSQRLLWGTLIELTLHRSESAKESRERLGWPPLSEEQQAENLEHNLRDILG